MIPGPWAAVILVFAAYRLTRLAGWDEFPLAARIRAWVIGEEWVPAILPPDDLGHVDTAEHGFPGKQPSSVVAEVQPAYRRPTLAHLVHCPFCVGAYISLATYGAWLLWPTGSLYALFPFALSGAVGLISKNWDA